MMTQGGTAVVYPSEQDRAFWIEIRRSLIQIVRTIDQFHGIDPSRSRARAILTDGDESDHKTR